MTTATSVDLTNCDREPIHIPGSIQSHGVLMVLEEPALIIRQISQNTESMLGIPAEELLGKLLTEILSTREVAHIKRRILPKPLDETPHYLPAMGAGRLDHEFEGIIHRHQGALILELERWAEELHVVQEETYGALKSALVQMDRAETLVDFCQKAAERVKEFTGFDRVMVYRFGRDASGHVVAEARREDLESYLGLHYPAADIPKQARELFKRSQLRLNPDVRYRPVPVLPVLRPDTGQPLDMSYCITRSMSPIHAEYLQNMGVDASMSISIVVNDELWGLFACHHYAPRYVPHGIRMACEFLAHTLSLQVASREAAEQSEYAAQLHREHRQLVAALDTETDLTEALRPRSGEFMGGIHAQGAALVFNHRVHCFGETPPEASIKKLVEMLGEHVEDAVWGTDRLGQRFPGFAEISDTASGVLAARLSRQGGAYLFWFRPGEAQTVNWAGDPNKAVVASGPNGDRLTPRQSFALWQETVQGRSTPWMACEYEAARILRQSLLEHFVRHTEELVRLNADLEERNRQLDSFAYVASHDLKEPLRGIRNYSQFLLEDCGEEINDEGKGYIRTMMRLTHRMEMLLDSLLHYSRLSRLDLHADEVDLNETLADALEMVAARVEEKGARISVPQKLPIVLGDRDRLSEVFSNLISNAIKYNDKATPEIAITFESSNTDNTLVIQVRDNGIGIAPEHRNIIFQIFKRLHGRDQYGGGIGAGLTIVRKIVERHGGTIWVESQMGKSTTFSFTLPLPPPHAS